MFYGMGILFLNIFNSWYLAYGLEGYNGWETKIFYKQYAAAKDSPICDVDNHCNVM